MAISGTTIRRSGDTRLLSLCPPPKAVPIYQSVRVFWVRFHFTKTPRAIKKKKKRLEIHWSKRTKWHILERCLWFTGYDLKVPSWRDGERLSGIGQTRHFRGCTTWNHVCDQMFEDQHVYLEWDCVQGQLSVAWGKVRTLRSGIWLGQEAPTKLKKESITVILVEIP